MDLVEEQTSAARIVYYNNEKVAHAVSHYLNGLRPSPQRFVLRPYTGFWPQCTEWWLVPSNEWPAYRSSKLFFLKSQVAQGEEWFYTGFYVEKGLGEQLANLADVKKAHIMHKDWYWHSFIFQTKAEKMDSAVREVLLRSGRPIIMSMDVYGFNQVPEPDTERLPPYDLIEFVVQSQDGKFRLGRPGSEILAQLNSCASLSELAQRLEELKDLEYFWVNLVIGIRLRYGTDADGSWKSAEIWHRALEPWNSWVR